MNYNMDEKFKNYFQDNLKQVFLYLIDDCNLRCVQCLYKLDICFQVEKKEIAFEDAVKLISDFRKLGAVKLTLMGRRTYIIWNKRKEQTTTRIN